MPPRPHVFTSGKGRSKPMRGKPLAPASLSALVVRLSDAAMCAQVHILCPTPGAAQVNLFHSEAQRGSTGSSGSPSW